MYLLDTRVVSELRKGACANAGVMCFVERLAGEDAPAYISVIALAKLRRGLELICHRGDLPQAQTLEVWLQSLLDDYADQIP